MLESTDMTTGLGTPNEAAYVSGLAAMPCPIPPARAEGLTSWASEMGACVASVHTCTRGRTRARGFVHGCFLRLENFYCKTAQFGGLSRLAPPADAKLAAVLNDESGDTAKRRANQFAQGSV